MKDDLYRPWVLSFSDTKIRPLFPRYRGAFEADESPPKRVRLASRIEEGGASARFRAPFFPRRRSFGVSVEIPPETWQPAGSRRGWYFFTHGDFHLAIYSSLPATWLAQTPGGTPLPPPWRELWSFGTDHIWSCRIYTAADFPGKEAFSALIPHKPCRFSGRVLPETKVGGKNGVAEVDQIRTVDKRRLFNEEILTEPIKNSPEVHEVLQVIIEELKVILSSSLRGQPKNEIDIV